MIDWVAGKEKGAAHLLTLGYILHHVLIRLILCVDSSFRTLNGECKRIDDDKGVAHDFALHETHDLMRNARSCVDDLEVNAI